MKLRDVVSEVVYAAPKALEQAKNKFAGYIKENNITTEQLVDVFNSFYVRDKPKVEMAANMISIKRGEYTGQITLNTAYLINYMLRNSAVTGFSVAVPIAGVSQENTNQIAKQLFADVKGIKELEFRGATSILNWREPVEKWERGNDISVGEWGEKYRNCSKVFQLPWKDILPDTLTEFSSRNNCIAFEGRNWDEEKKQQQDADKALQDMITTLSRMPNIRSVAIEEPRLDIGGLGSLLTKPGITGITLPSFRKSLGCDDSLAEGLNLKSWNYAYGFGWLKQAADREGALTLVNIHPDVITDLQKHIDSSKFKVLNQTQYNASISIGGGR